MKKNVREILLLSLISFFIFFITACYITYPLVFHIGDYATGLGDELLIAWIQNWVIHALTTNIFTLFNANIYYPYLNTLSYSETFISSSILALPIKLLIGQPITTVNVTLISSLFILGFSVYLLSYYLTKDFIVSLFSGVLVIFSPAVLSNYIQLQLLDIGWVPLSLLFFIIFIQTKKSKYFLISIVFFLIQVYNSILPSYFILFSDIIVLCYSWFFNRKNLAKLVTIKNAIILFVFFILILPLAVSYYSVALQFHYSRDIRDTIHFALEQEDLLYSSQYSRLYTLLDTLPFNTTSQNNEFKPGYLGFVFSVLVLLTFYYFIKNMKKKKSFYINIFITIAVLGLIFSFGPFLHINRYTVHKPFPIPLPYILFYYLVPGLNGIRNTHLWEMLFIIGMAIAIAIVISDVTKKIPSKFKNIGMILLFAGVIGEFNFPMQYVQVPQVKNFPPVYSWMKTVPQNAVFIQMPIYIWNMQPYVFSENLREYESTVEFHRMVNGASGFSPDPWQQMVITLMENFPSSKTIRYLKSIGVTYIIVHKSEYDTLNSAKILVGKKKINNGETIIHSLLQNRMVHLVKQFGSDYVFKIL